TRLDVNRTVKQRLGVRKASFANPDETRNLTGMELGGVTVFGLPPGLPIWVDGRVMRRERIILGGGDRSCKVSAAPDILRALAGDVAVESAVQRAVRAAVERWGGLDVVVNNAGAGRGPLDPTVTRATAGAGGRVEDMAPDSWDEQLSQNLRTTFLTTKAAVPH